MGISFSSSAIAPKDTVIPEEAGSVEAETSQAEVPETVAIEAAVSDSEVTESGEAPAPEKEVLEKASEATQLQDENTIVEDIFGFLTDAKSGERTLIRRFTLRNKRGLSVQVISYGATITTINVPDKHGELGDVNMGFDDIDGYVNIGETEVNPHFGAIIGRVANRIGKAQFRIGEHEYHVSKNAGENHLHGGFIGFDKKVWECRLEGTRLHLSYVSRDGEEGYPGEVRTHASYELNDEGELLLEMDAEVSQPTPVNLTNHAYFNLAGHGSGAAALYEHQVMINADCYTPAVDTIPTGNICTVEDTVLDLRTACRLADIIPLTIVGGYDLNYCVNQQEPSPKKNYVSKVVHEPSGRVLEVYSDQPGVQFYTSNHLPEGDIVKGKGGAFYKKHGAFCLETQLYPDAVNQPSFPNSIIHPGQKYTHSVVYRFSTQ